MFQIVCLKIYDVVILNCVAKNAKSFFLQSITTNRSCLHSNTVITMAVTTFFSYFKQTMANNHSQCEYKCLIFKVVKNDLRIHTYIKYRYFFNEYILLF